MTHSVATLASARERLAYVVGRCKPGTQWYEWLTESQAIANDNDALRRGTLKSFISEGMELDTLQVTIGLDDGKPSRLRSAWQPGARIVDGVAATYFTANGSRRDFKGIETLVCTNDLYVGFDKWGDDVVLVAYRVLS